MAYRVQITEPARQDAQDYAAFLRDEQKSPDAAVRWLATLFEAMSSLNENPERFSVIPEAEELGFPYRSFIHDSHRVVYAVHEGEQLVIIHRVYHGARKPITSDKIQ